MQPPAITPQSRLHGISIFLSASVPTPERHKEYAPQSGPQSAPNFERIDQAALKIEEAVLSISRAIFMEGGTLVFGGHPSISPLVARVVQNYYLPAPAEATHSEGRADERPVRWKNPSVLIYQSKVWEKYLVEATLRLQRHPLVTVVHCEVADGETVDPTFKGGAQATQSLDLMRKTMIQDTHPVAMIAIGGMQGIVDEARIFADKRPGCPIYAFTTTGGAAALLPQMEGLEGCVSAGDEEALARVRKFWADQAKMPEQARKDDRSQEQQERQFYVPYGLVAQQVVEKIVQSLRR